MPWDGQLEYGSQYLNKSGPSRAHCIGSFADCIWLLSRWKHTSSLLLFILFRDQLHPRKSLRNAIFSLWSRKLKAFVGSWFWLRRGTGWGFAIFVWSSVNANLEGVAISFKNHRWLNSLATKKTNSAGPLDHQYSAHPDSSHTYLSSWYGNCRDPGDLSIKEACEAAGMPMMGWINILGKPQETAGNHSFQEIWIDLGLVHFLFFTYPIFGRPVLKQFKAIPRVWLRWSKVSDSISEIWKIQAQDGTGWRLYCNLLVVTLPRK